MGIQSRYRHTLVVKRLAPTYVPVHDPPGPTDGDPILDEYSQPVMAETTVATVSGLLQPRSAREVAQANQAGAVIGEYVAYMDPLATLGTDCWLELAGVRYDVVSISDAAGLGHHLEVGCRRVAS